MAQASSFQAQLAAGDLNAEIISGMVSADKRLLDFVFHGMAGGLPRVRFGCAKALLLLSANHPELLCEKIDRLVEMLDCGNQILKWNGILILGNLAAADSSGKVIRQLNRLHGFLTSGELITANNAIAALGRIACAFPEERKRITTHLLGVEHQRFETDECRNIAIGKVILAIETFTDPAKPGKPVLDFIRRQTGNSRKATAKKAESFMGKCMRLRATA